MKTKIGLLFDGDILLYRAGFAAEKRVYRPSPGSALQRSAPWAVWTSAKAAKQDCDRLGYSYKTDVTWERQPEPVENAIHNLNSLITNVRNGFASDEIIHTWSALPTAEIPVEVFIFITGCGTKPNFREALDPAYKANRDPAHKPIHLNALKTYIQEHYPTIVTQGCEADDYLGQAQHDMERIHPDMLPVIVTLDKDLQQIPGYKYDFVAKELTYNSQEEGDKFFFRQMLSGDKADNISGLRGYGPVKIDNLFAKCVSVDDYRKKAQQAYIGSYANKDNAIRAWNTNCDLLWIWRQVPDVCPYKIPV